MPQKLTIAQRRMLSLIHAYLTERGYPPSFRELAKCNGGTSTNAVSDALKILERKGYIRRDPKVARGIVILREA